MIVTAANCLGRREGRARVSLEVGGHWGCQWWGFWRKTSPLNHPGLRGVVLQKPFERGAERDFLRYARASAPTGTGVIRCARGTVLFVCSSTSLATRLYLDYFARHGETSGLHAFRLDRRWVSDRKSWIHRVIFRGGLSVVLLECVFFGLFC